MKEQFDLITIGGATEDLFLTIDNYQIIDNPRDILAQKLLAIEYGAKTLAKKSFLGYGGGASNVAVAVARHGLKSTIMTAIGDDQRGNNILKNLKSHGVGSHYVQVIAEQQSAVSVVLIGQDGEHSVICYRGANDLMTIDPNTIAEINSPWLYISSLSGQNWHKNLVNIFSSNKLIAWNPGQTQLMAGIAKLKKFLSKTAILIINHDEALQLVSTDTSLKPQQIKTYNQNIELLIKKIASYGSHLVIITKDKEGAWSYDGGELMHQPAYLTKNVVDTTGVGDAFSGTFIANFIITNNVRQSLRAAAQQSAIILKAGGAQSWPPVKNIKYARITRGRNNCKRS